MGLNYAIYVVVNKDNDEMYFEWVNLDHEYGYDMLMRAYSIIHAPGNVPPPKAANSAAAPICKMCQFKNVCHYNEAVERNCRSCVNSQAAENGQWFCKLYQQIIPEDYIAKGCDNHVGIQ